jgi:tripartite-type tricarboxylate transporter receptor subunit TctC
MKEVGLPQIDFPLWSGLLGPPAMARATVDIVARAANAATRDPKVVEVRTRLGLSSLSGGPEDLARTIAREYDGTARLIREAGLKID